MDILSNFGILILTTKTRKATWKPLQLALHKKIVNQKQYCILGEIAEISDTTRYLKDAEVVIPTISHSNCLMQNTDISRGITVDYNKFN